MKTFRKIIILVSLVVVPVLFALADPPGPPPPGGNPSGTGNQVGAPIDGGLLILLMMGAAYGTRKIYNLRKEEK